MSELDPEIFKLHADSYSNLIPFYEALTTRMQDVRRCVLVGVLRGESVASERSASIGFGPLTGPFLRPLSREASILDVGCATGDNLPAKVPVSKYPVVPVSTRKGVKMMPNGMSDVLIIGAGPAGLAE